MPNIICYRSVQHLIASAPSWLRTVLGSMFLVVFTVVVTIYSTVAVLGLNEPVEKIIGAYAEAYESKLLRKIYE